MPPDICPRPVFCFASPPDYQQRDGANHVCPRPSSLDGHVLLQRAGGGKRISINLAASRGRHGSQSHSANRGSVYLLALATGSIWGKPMWGTWWVWDVNICADSLFSVCGIHCVT